MKQSGVRWSDSKENYHKEKSVLHISFIYLFSHFSSTSLFFFFASFYSIWSVDTLLPYLYDSVLFSSYTLGWKMLAGWVAASLSPICLFPFPVKWDIHKKGLKSQHVLANAEWPVISLSFCASISWLWNISASVFFCSAGRIKSQAETAQVPFLLWNNCRICMIIHTYMPAKLSAS